MSRGLWPAFLTLAFIGFGLLGIWDMTWLAFQTLDAIRSQIQGEPLKPPAAPSWKPLKTDPFGAEWTAPPAAAGRHVRDIPLGVRDDVLGTKEGIMALGIDNSGDYAPLMMQNDGAVRSAGKANGSRWVAIRVDDQGRVICSPESFWGLNLAPGETMIIHGPKPTLKIEVRP